MRILVLSPDAPFPPDSGGRMRTYNLLQALAERHHVTCITFTTEDCLEKRSLPIDVVPVPWEQPPLYAAMHSEDNALSQSAYQHLLNESPEPWFVSCYAVPAMEQVIRNLPLTSFDVAIVEHTFMGRFLPLLPDNLPIILDMHNVHALMAIREAQAAEESRRESALREARRTVEFERQLVRQCSLIVTCSSSESDAARRLLGASNVHVVPNGVNSSHFVPLSNGVAGGGLLFTGMMNYRPNVEAVQYFVHSIFPLVLQSNRRAVLHIVGKNPDDEVRSLGSDNVVVHGAVPDMRPYYASTEVAIVPLLRGGGTRLKILEATASGTSIVTTSLGTEGLDFQPGRDLVVADTPGDFATAVIRLLRDPNRRAELGRNARRVATAYDWNVIAPRFRELVESISGRVAESPDTPAEQAYVVRGIH